MRIGILLLKIAISLSYLASSLNSYAIDNAGVKISGELKKWHTIALVIDGPFARETDSDPNPFLDYRMNVTFRHSSGAPVYVVPGHFAADANAANSSANAGNKWRVFFSPDKEGQWHYAIEFVKGKKIAISEESGVPVMPFHGIHGSFFISPTDKRGKDFRARGRLDYVGARYLQFKETGDFFLKVGADAPETFLAYADFDNTYARKNEAPLKTWKAHIKDWRPGDPFWGNGKGKGIIGALNYLSGKGINSVSFITYNAGGDGDNVWPYVDRNDKLHFDCSKLDQWLMVFEHATKQGIFLHFKLQETENDDNWKDGKQQIIPESLDGGDLGIERRLYLRELVSRFSHLLALNWNLGEENTQSPEQLCAMADYLRNIDPYKHHIVVHTFPDWQDRVYSRLLGEKSVLTGASLQNHWKSAHQRTLKWINESAEHGKQWVVCNDEQNPPDLGVPPDPDYLARSWTNSLNSEYTIHDIRKYTLWGVFMAGGAGVEYYFGYKYPQNDLNCEDWRSRDQSWSYCKIAIDFFSNTKIPFWEMTNADALVGNPNHDNTVYCMAKVDQYYLIYLPTGGSTELNINSDKKYSISWYNPRKGGCPVNISTTITGQKPIKIGPPPYDIEEDWVALVRSIDNVR
jgi:hypothetical protein